MTTYGYARQSHDDTSGQTIDQQERKLTAWAELEGVGPIKLVIDRGVSGGKRMADRPAGGPLLERLRRGDTVVVSRLDRLSRNVHDFLTIVTELDARGVRLALLDVGVDTTTPTGRLIVTVMAALSQLEREIVSQRMIAANKELDAQGRLRGHLPFGFIAAPHPSGKGKVARPHPEQAPIVRHMVKMIEEGHSISATARYAGLAPVVAGRLLRNRRLYGWTPSGRTDVDAAIITKARFDALQKIMPTRSGGWARVPSWARLITCYGCGLPLAHVSGPGQYTCEGAHMPEHTEQKMTRVAITRRLADETLREAFLGRCAGLPIIDLHEHAEGPNLSGINRELEELSSSLATAPDMDAVVAQIKALRAERDAAQPKTTRTWKRSDERAADHVDALLPMAVRATLRPRGVKPRLAVVVAPVSGFIRRKDDSGVAWDTLAHEHIEALLV